jgi:polyferredoxin
MFVTLSNGDIRNGYTIKISNKTNKDRTYGLGISGIENLTLKTRENITTEHLPVKSRQIGSFKIYVKANYQNLDKISGRNKIDFTITETETKMERSHDAIFISE